MTPIRSIGSVDDRTLLEVARSAFLETCAADRRDGLTAHSLDTRGEVRFGDAALHELAEVSSTRRERLFVAGEARALLYVDVGVIHGRDDDVDASTAGFELSCGPMRIEKRHGEHLSTEGSAALRGRLERLLTQRAALRLSPTTPPSTPLDWNQRVLSCELYQRVPFDGGPAELAVASYGSRWFGVLLSSDFHYAPIGWIPRPTAPVMTDEAVSAHGERVLADLDALALALGLPPPVVLHRESFTADPESRSRGFATIGSTCRCRGATSTLRTVGRATGTSDWRATQTPRAYGAGRSSRRTTAAPGWCGGAPRPHPTTRPGCG